MKISDLWQRFINYPAHSETAQQQAEKAKRAAEKSTEEESAGKMGTASASEKDPPEALPGNAGQTAGGYSAQTAKERDFIIKVVYIVMVLGLLYAFLFLATGMMLPFFLGLIITFMLVPLVRLISTKTIISWRLTAMICLLVFYGLIILLLTLAGASLTDHLIAFARRMPQVYVNSIQPALQEFTDKLAFLPPEYSHILDTATQKIFEVISSLSSYLVSMITSLAGVIPNAVITIVFTILSSVILTLDYRRVRAFVLRQFSPRGAEFLKSVKFNSVNVVGRMIRAYALLMFITFCELSLGLGIIRHEWSFLAAMLIAIVDIIPVLGTGTVLVPWCLIELLNGNLGMALGLIILYVIILVVRYALEPKIVGDTIGVHPVVMLMCMFIGAKLFGPLGLFLLPITVTVIKKLSDAGVVKVFK